jgi:predicted Zn-dependent peptidase
MAREKLRRYIDTNYHTGNAVFIAAGNVQHKQICDWVLKYTKDIKHGPKAEYVKPTFKAANVALPREVEQIHMMLAAPCATHHEPDYYATQVFSQLMGGGFSSRLFTEVREKRGLVYHVSSFNIQYSDIGIFNVYASATPDKAGEVLRVAADELARVAGTVTDEELARAKMQIKARLLMQMESTSARTDRIGDQWHTYGRIIPMSETVAAIEAVTAADIDRVAKGICKGQIAVGTCGPVAQIKDMPDVAARIAA